MKVIDLLNYSASFYKKDCTKRIKELSEIMELDLKRKIAETEREISIQNSELESITSNKARTEENIAVLKKEVKESNEHIKVITQQNKELTSELKEFERQSEEIRRKLVLLVHLWETQK